MAVALRNILENKKTNKNTLTSALTTAIQNQMTRPYRHLKTHYYPVIPLHIYQTWSTKNLKPAMLQRVEQLKAQNPAFEHHLYDDADCREFIKEHFKPDVLDAYDNLIPGAYKADLWRLCVLFINGGIYMDIKLACINGFKLIELTEAEHLVLDRLPPLSIYNALMVARPGNPLLYQAIRRIVSNVQNRFYGSNALEPTGPLMLGNLILSTANSQTSPCPVNIDIKHYKDGGYLIYKNQFVISTEYPEYNSERLSTYNSKATKRYDLLWNERRIYGK